MKLTKTLSLRLATFILLIVMLFLWDQASAQQEKFDSCIMGPGMMGN